MRELFFNKNFIKNFENDRTPRCCLEIYLQTSKIPLHCHCIRPNSKKYTVGTRVITIRQSNVFINGYFNDLFNSVRLVRKNDIIETLVL